MTHAKKGKKTGMIIGGIAAALIIILIVAFFSITGSATSAATLNLEAGDVQVDTGKGWTPAQDGMELDIKDKVKTGADGEASIILYESAIVSLEPDTEVTISELSEENVAIKQNTGSTWNKFTGLSGLKGLEVETPNTVATVRGTEFGVTMDDVPVMEGDVEVRDKNTGDIVNVPAGKRAFRQNDKLTMNDLSPEQYNRLITKMEKNIARMQRMREKEINKHPTIVNMIKNRYNMDDETLRQKLREADEGAQTIDEQAIMEKSPVKIASLQKVVRLTKSIQEQNRAIAELKNAMPPDPLGAEEPRIVRSYNTRQQTTQGR